MAITIHRVTKQITHGAQRLAPGDWPDADYLYVSRPAGDSDAIANIVGLINAAVPSYYWNLVDGPPKRVLEMNQTEKDAVDAARATAADLALEQAERSVLIAPAAPGHDYQEFVDDFMGGIDPNVWATVGTGGAVALISPGVVRITSLSVLGTEQKGIVSNSLLVQAAGFQHFMFRLREETVGTQVVIGGLYQNASNYLAFMRQNGGNWFAAANKAGVLTTVNTGVPGNGRYKLFRFERSNGNAVFRIDGKQVATIPFADAPTTGAFEFTVRVMANTLAQPNRSVDLDTVRFRVDRP